MPTALISTSQASDHVREFWTFGPYVLDAQGQLRLGPTAIHLAPLQRRLLLALVRQRGQLLSREQLLEAVWGHANVSEVSISRTVHGLRRVFAEGPLGAAVIRTIYGGGYRLELPIHGGVERDTAAPAQGAAESPYPSASTLSAFVEGMVLVRQRDPRLLDRAERHLRRCLEQAPGFTPALVQLAATQLRRYQWGWVAAETLESSLESLLRQAEATGHQATDVLALRVEALSLLHWQPDLAESRFGGWLPEQLSEGTGLHSWGRHLLATGRAAETIRLLEPQLQPDNLDGWLLVATARWLLGEHGKATDDLRQQLRLDGSLMAPRLLLALVNADAGHAAEALRELEALGLQGHLSEGLEAAVALVLAWSGHSAQALARLRTELARSEGTRTMTSFWGLAALAAGDESAAATLLEEAVRRRCGLAPLVRHLPGLRRHASSQALNRFQAAMTNRFLRTF